MTACATSIPALSELPAPMLEDLAPRLLRLLHTTEIVAVHP